jgi:capsular polysaccharide biosynthesis protein
LKLHDRIETTFMDNFFNNQRILDVIWKRKIHFVIIGVIAIILSAIFSGPAFITPKYKSVARIYPSNIWSMSEESTTEQMIEVLNSADIKFKMFDAFNLAEEYKIDREDPKYITYMLDAYNTNVTVSKTEYETAEIKVMDYDPQQASDMCDSIIHFYNRKIRAMHKAKDKEMVDILKGQIDVKYEEKTVLEHQIDSIRNATGIISFSNQIPELTRGYMTALATGRGSAPDTKKIEKLYENFSNEGTKSVFAELKFNRVVHTIDSLTMLYEARLVEYNKDITYSHIVEYPFPADKKSYPVRWLIVLLSTVSAVFLGLLVFVVLDYRKAE